MNTLTVERIGESVYLTVEQAERTTMIILTLDEATRLGGLLVNRAIFAADKLDQLLTDEATR